MEQEETVSVSRTPELDRSVDTEELRQLAETFARRAGELIRSRGTSGAAVADTKSSPTDVVTATDREVESLLRALIAERRPQDAILGEEVGLGTGDSDLTWVVDPIDGTVNFVYGIPAFAVSVAVVSGDPQQPGAWRPLAGCVHNPVSGLTWTAAADGGAFLDGRQLRLGAPPALEGALVATGFGYRAERRIAQSRVLAGLLGRVRDIRRMGAASLDLCMVASGQVDAYYERGLNVWDMAAGVLIVTEAGGQVRGIDGVPAGEHMTVAAAAPLSDVLAGELSALGAGAD